jgi:hypothetical protein
LTLLVFILLNYENYPKIKQINLMKTLRKITITILTATILLDLLSLNSLQAQALCPGGGVNFSSAVMFQPSWIQGCLTGTSCNGGTEMDNRSS